MNLKVSQLLCQSLDIFCHIWLTFNFFLSTTFCYLGWTFIKAHSPQQSIIWSQNNCSLLPSAADWHVGPLPELGMINGYFLWCLGLGVVSCCTALGSLGGNGIMLQPVVQTIIRYTIKKNWWQYQVENKERNQNLYNPNGTHSIRYRRLQKIQYRWHHYTQL